MAAPDIEIRGSGGSFGVFLNGVQLGKANCFDNACIRARAWENRLQQQQRDCICCGHEFTAEGRFNRICGTCKAYLA